jgi:HSP20 family molecular chaperone IbpA
MADPGKAVQRLTEQVEALRDAFGEDFWRQFAEQTAGLPSTPEQGGRVEAPRKGTSVTGPPMDIYVTPEEVVVHAALPGLIDPQHAMVSLTSPTEMLMEAFLPPRLPEGMYLHKERFAGYCSRLVTLPVSVRPAAAARYEDGILEIRFRRAEPGAGTDGVAVLRLG